MGLAILGLGRVAEMHAQAILGFRPNAFAGGWNRTLERAEVFCKRFGGKAYPTLEELLADQSIDSVLVSTSTETHFELARHALEAGKHVLLEKPLCQTSAQIAELAEVARSTSRICMPSHNYIYAPSMRRIRDRISSGDLGKVVSYWAFFNNRHPADIGLPDLVMRELMVHHAYSMLFFLGRPSSVVATASNVYFQDPGAPDQIMITAEFDDGAIANLWGSFSTDDLTREPWSVYFKILGTRGSAMAPWDLVKFGSEPEPLWDDSSYRDSFLYTQQYFLDECVAKGAEPLSTLDDAYAAARVLDAARQSLNEGARILLGY